MVAFSAGEDGSRNGKTHSPGQGTNYCLSPTRDQIGRLHLEDLEFRVLPTGAFHHPCLYST